MKFVFFLFLVGIVTYSDAGKGWKNELDEVQSNRLDQSQLVLAGDAAPFELKIMDTDVKRFVEIHQKRLTKRK